MKILVMRKIVSDNNQNGNLNARSDVHVPTVYKDKLDYVLKDSNIKNIAITAPYDSGKTSFLRHILKIEKQAINGILEDIILLSESLILLRKNFSLTPNCYQK